MSYFRTQKNYYSATSACHILVYIMITWGAYQNKDMAPVLRESLGRDLQYGFPLIQPIPNPYTEACPEKIRSVRNSGSLTSHKHISVDAKNVVLS